MPTTWDKVEVQTEKVIDENPEVWVAAAKKSLKNKNFNEALDNAQQAIQFANQSGNRSVLPECYAIQIYAYYEKNEKYNAQKIKDAYFSQGLKEFLMKNPDYVVVFKWHNNNEWYPFWEEIIKSWIRNLDLDNIKKYADLIDDRFLAQNATDKLAIAAAEKNYFVCLEKLYRGDYNLSAVRNGDNDNLTMIALGNANTKVSDFLLIHGINNVNDKNNENQTALMIAVALTKDATTVQCLINMGARVNDRDNTKGSALMMTDNAQIAEYLIKAGADIEAKDDMNCTPLMLAAGAGYTSVAKVLVNYGANINTTAKEGYTPLMNAIANEHTDTANFLINSGADVNHKNQDGLTALMFAVKMDNIEIGKALIKAGADIDAKNKMGMDALALSFFKSYENMELLLKAGANPNKLYEGKTLLHRAAQDQHWKYPHWWKSLLYYNADVNIKDMSGYTALEYSLDHNWTFSDELDMARALVKKGAEVTSRARRIMRENNIESSKLYNNESSNLATKLFKGLFG